MGGVAIDVSTGRHDASPARDRIDRSGGSSSLFFENAESGAMPLHCAVVRREGERNQQSRGQSGRRAERQTHEEPPSFETGNRGEVGRQNGGVAEFVERLNDRCFFAATTPPCRPRAGEFVQSFLEVIAQFILQSGSRLMAWSRPKAAARRSFRWKLEILFGHRGTCVQRVRVFDPA